MTSPQLHISHDFTLPLQAATETIAILAVKRAGKSNAAVVLAEEMYDAGIPWVAIDPKGDWWGVRAADNGNEKGLAVLVFGGLHSDVPLEPTAGRLVADLIVEQRITAVLDVSEMTKADQRRFLTDFADRLYRTNTEPLHVFCEEADEYIPQRVMGENAKLVGVFETLVKRGGFRGIGITLITQRSASLNKDVLTQAGTLIAMRTPSSQDRKAVKAWVDFHAASDEMLAELPTLSAGEAWVFSPEWLKTVEKITFRRRRTFDSGATPKVGETRRTPTNLADVDLAAIKEAMAETIERAKADDPKTLRARIRELEKHQCPTVEPERVEVPVLTDADLEAFRQMRDSLPPVVDALDRAITAAVIVLKPLAGVQPVNEAVARGGPSSSTDSNGGTPARTAPRRPSVAPAGGETPNLKAGARRILETLARHHPMRMTRAQLGTLAKFKVTGGTFQTYWSTLKRAGLVEEHDGLIVITDAGLAYVGHVPAAPMTTEELLDQWRSALKAGARLMLDQLVTWYPGSLSREDLARDVGMTATGGTFQTYLSTLRRNGLIEIDSDGVRASDTLFLGGPR